MVIASIMYLVDTIYLKWQDTCKQAIGTKLWHQNSYNIQNTFFFHQKLIYPQGNGT